MNILLLPFVFAVHASVVPDDLMRHLDALNEGRPEAEICALTAPAIDAYDTMIASGLDDAEIAYRLRGRLDPRRVRDLRPRLLEILAACLDAD